MERKEEAIAMLQLLKGEAQKSFKGTVILNVKIDNFNFVIDETIKLLEEDVC